jgi:hypothetical protein
MCSLLTSTFSIIFSPSASPFTFYLRRVLNVHNWAFDFIRFFDPLFSLCVSLSSLQTRLWMDFGSKEDIYIHIYELCFQTFEQMRFSSA